MNSVFIFGMIMYKCVFDFSLAQTKLFLTQRVCSRARGSALIPGLRDHPYITSAKGLGGWVDLENGKMASFVDVQHSIYADIVGW